MRVKHLVPLIDGSMVPLIDDRIDMSHSNQINKFFWDSPNKFRNYYPYRSIQHFLQNILQCDFENDQHHMHVFQQLNFEVIY